MRQQAGGIDPAVRSAAAGRALEAPWQSPWQSLDRASTGFSPRSSFDSRYGAGGASPSAIQVSRPVAASPFAAAAARLSSRQLEAAALPAALSGQPSLPEEAAEPDPEEVIELLKHRAQQEATHLSGRTATGGTSGTSASHPTSSGASTPPASIVFAALPAALSSWVVPRTAVVYQHRPDGSLHVLGEGAR